MAQRRMFSMKIIDTDAFLEMPGTSQNLYFHLCMRADDDGFVSAPRKIMKIVNASNDDFKILLSKRFILLFEPGIIVIKHWRMHNFLRKDRYVETNYTEEKSMLRIKKNGAYTERQPNGNQMATKWQPNGNQMAHSIGKDSIGKDSIGKKFIMVDKNRPYIALSKLLYERHKTLHDPGFLAGKDLEKTFFRWANDIRMLCEIDKREKELVKKVIIWCQEESNFWPGNILSGSKLRKQFPKLLCDMKFEKNKQKGVDKIDSVYNTMLMIGKK